MEGLAVPLAGGNEYYTKATVQEEVELEEPIETSIDLLWTTKGAAAETLISISSLKNWGMWKRVALGQR